MENTLWKLQDQKTYLERQIAQAINAGKHDREMQLRALLLAVVNRIQRLADEDQSRQRKAQREFLG
jgi:hypothetical protein